MVDDLLLSDDLTLLELELSLDVNDVLEFHTQALKKLGQLKAERAGRLCALLKSQGEPHDLAAQLADEEEERISKWQQEIGALALNMLSEGLKNSLNRAKAATPKSHTSSCKKGKGERGNWLTKRQDKFKDDYGIDFEKSPRPFFRVVELELARNAGIHKVALKKYKDEFETKTEQPRFIGVDETGEESLSVARRDLEQLGADVRSFNSWVISQLKGIRDKSK